MKTRFLTFASEQLANDVLSPYLEVNPTTAVDILGILYEEPYEEDVEPTPLPGWHINILASVLPTDFIQYEVFPKTPRRVFAS